MEPECKKSEIKFKIDDKDYNLFIDDSSIDGFVVDKGSKKNIEEKSDVCIIESVLDALTPNIENSVEVDTIFIEDKKYKVFLDKEIFVYFFYEIDGCDYKTPDSNVIARLNKMYNHIAEVKYSGNKNKIESPVEIQRKVRIGNKMISIFITATMIFNMIPKEHKWKIDYAIKNYTSDIDEFLDTLDYNEYQNGAIEKAIKNNANLTEDEKLFLQNLGSVIEENIDYLNIKSVLSNLENLKIIYKEKSKNGDLYNFTLGEYRVSGTNRNTITIYRSTTFDDASKNVIFHEVSHSLSCESKLYSLPSPMGDMFYLLDTSSFFRINILEELANELFSREYISYLTPEYVEYVGYNTFMPLMYAMCEIIDPEVLREYKFTHDASILIKELESIDGNPDKAYSFLTGFTTFSMYHSNVYKEQSEENILLYFNKAQEMFRTIKYYYEKKYDVPMESDFIMSLYFYKTIYSNEELNSRVQENLRFNDDVKIVITPKNYLAHSGKDHMTVTVVGRFRNNTFEIDESNRYMECGCNIPHKVS